MIRHVYRRGKQFLISLRVSILSVFITLLLITSFSIVGLITWHFILETNQVARQSMQYIAHAVLQHLRVVLVPAKTAVQFSGHLIEQGGLQTNPRQMALYTYYLLQIMPVGERVFWAAQNGDFIYSYKNEKAAGDVTTEIYLRSIKQPLHITIQRDKAGHMISQTTNQDMAVDPRTFAWYKKATQLQHFYWTNLHRFYGTDHGWGVTALHPLWTANHQFLGVFGMNVTLNFLSYYITHQKSLKGLVFIVTQNEDLVAYPHVPLFSDAISKAGQLLNVHDVSLPIIDHSLDLYKTTHQQESITLYHDVKYLVSYQPVPDLAQYGWLIGVIVPERYFTMPLLKLNITTLGVSGLILLIGILLVSTLVSGIVNPIKRLVKETERIKKFELDAPISFPSHIKEVVLLRDAISAMKNGLKQFQKYVPRSLVQHLIRTGTDTDVGGQRKPLTVFFSDITDFTTIVSHIDPNRLMVQLCEYFELMTEIIHEEHGTIDKYIGDELMAFWGAPLVYLHPCEHAAKTALACLTALKRRNEIWQTQGKPQFHTRIGIHIGDAIVGNIGSSERLNYTAIGDTINTASRLQHLNEIYHTNILVSEEVYLILKDEFVLRLVDTVILRGKETPITIYELLRARE